MINKKYLILTSLTMLPTSLFLVSCSTSVSLEDVHIKIDVNKMIKNFEPHTSVFIDSTMQTEFTNLSLNNFVESFNENPNAFIIPKKEAPLIGGLTPFIIADDKWFLSTNDENKKLKILITSKDLFNSKTMKFNFSLKSEYRSNVETIYGPEIPTPIKTNIISIGFRREPEVDKPGEQSFMKKEEEWIKSFFSQDNFKYKDSKAQEEVRKLTPTEMVKNMNKSYFEANFLMKILPPIYSGWNYEVAANRIPSENSKVHLVFTLKNALFPDKIIESKITLNYLKEEK